MSEFPYDIGEELDEWAEQCAEEKTAKSGAVYWYFDFKQGKRAADLITLLERLKELGGEKGSFTAGPIRTAIIAKTLGPKHIYEPSSKYARACVVVGKELNDAIRKVFGKESSYYKENGKKRDIVIEKSDLEKENDLLELRNKEIERVTSERRSIESSTDDSESKEKRRPWEEVKKELIKSGQLEESKYEADPEILALFGEEPNE